uniref:Uncharacterized protein n=1 Tax=Siphoviridae sp. ctmqu18 TaxID=2825655 RepID=A0A8S5V672_9CAUD|nr:MAG TPA: hypothetical protein [Siphoviridae sp. ctmqu18]
MTVGGLRDVLLTKFDKDAELFFRADISIGNCDEKSDILCEFRGIYKVDNSVTIYLDEVEDS